MGDERLLIIYMVEACMHHGIKGHCFSNPKKFKTVSEIKMENKTEASVINVSSLTCIDLDNSDLHQLAVLLKHVCLHLCFLKVAGHGEKH